MLLGAKATKLKSFIKKSLAHMHKNPNDMSLIEKRWATVYQENQKSGFYNKIRKILSSVDSGIALEYGSSIGTMTKHLAKKATAFGIDKSFYAVREAKKLKQENLDFFVSNSLEHPFGKRKFAVLLALNLFELIEPKPLLKLLASQAKKDTTLVLSDPYDFERGTKSVKEPLYADSTRKEIAKSGFVISQDTKNPSFIPWNLKLHERATLQYLVDVIVARKS